VASPIAGTTGTAMGDLTQTTLASPVPDVVPNPLDLAMQVSISANPNPTVSPCPPVPAKEDSASPCQDPPASLDGERTQASSPPGPLDEPTELMNEAACVMDRREAGGHLALSLRPLPGSLASDLGELGADY